MGAISTILALIPKRLLFAAAGIVAGVALLAGVYAYGKHEGWQQAAVAAAEATAKAYKDRSDENANVDALDAVQLCVRLGASLQDCRDGLRGMGANPPQSSDGGLSRRP